MKNMARALAFVIPLLSLAGAGCYTQVGSVRDDKFSEEYGNEPAITEEYPAADDTASQDVDPYFDEYGNPRDRFYLGYTPIWVTIGGGWYDPWYYRPWYDDPFWCWNPGPGYYSTWWYGNPWHYPSYGWYPGHYAPDGRSRGTTRTFGNTRGSESGRGTLGITRDGSGSAGHGTPVHQDLPRAVRAGSSGRPAGKDALAPTRTNPGGTSNRNGAAVRGKTPGAGRSREAARPAPRRPARTEQPPAPPAVNPGSGSSGGGTRSGVSTPPPAQRPSGNDGGTRGSGSTRGGGGGGRR